MEQIATELIAKIKVAAGTEIPRVQPEIRLSPRPVTKAPLHKNRPTKVVAIGISTGGPNALQYLLSQLPGDFPGSIVVVQHMPEGFTEMFARRLDESCALQVKEARSGDVLLAGRALICPGNRHVRVRRMPLGDMVVLSDEPRMNGHRPSVEVLSHSLAQEFGINGVAVIMTGMGEDGAEAMGAVKAAGGLTVAQDEESCVVYGMPKVAIEKGYVSRVVPLEVLSQTLQVQCAAERARAVRA